jgi:glycosyltransferase involved in cell wall biosynthesis
MSPLMPRPDQDPATVDQQAGSPAVPGPSDSTLSTQVAEAGTRGRIFVLYNTARWMYRFRLPLMKRLQEVGFEVVGVSPPDEFVPRLQEAGIAHIPFHMDRKGTSPLDDVRLTAQLHRLFRTHRPDLILAYTIKPNVYGSIAARPLGIPVVNTIPGLGSLFVRRSLLTMVARTLYRIGLSGSRTVFFQNDEDLEFFLSARIVRGQVARRVPGSGVDTEHFRPRPGAATGNPFVFFFAGRLLWDKGIGELVEATRLLRGRGLSVETRLLGIFEPAGRAAIPPEQVQEWADQGLVNHLGESDQVVDFMAEADCVVLPSYYREGLPRSLLEAASMGKPLIAADAPGSRDVVEHGRNGFLCKVRDAGDLADKMQEMVELTDEQRAHMGRAGRERVLREFDQRVVVDRYLDVIQQILPHGPERA